MALATDQQVQTFANERVRVRCEQIRDLLLAMQSDKNVMDDIYSAVSQQTPTWSDNRTDGPPHLLTPSDILSYNTFISDLITAINNDSQLPVILKACVRPAQ